MANESKKRTRTQVKGLTQNDLHIKIETNKIVSFFTHKGGVGKTTSMLNISECILRGEIATNIKTICLVDLDPQMSVTSMIETDEGFLSHMEYLDKRLIGDIDQKEVRFDNFYDLYKSENDGDMKMRPKIWKKEGSTRIDLIKGCFEIPTLSSSVGTEIAIRQIGTSVSLIKRILNKLKRKYDLVFLDLNPSLSGLNFAIIMLSDYIISPCLADYYSIMNFKLIDRNFFKILPQFHLEGGPRMLGFLLNKVLIRNGEVINPVKVMKDKISQTIIDLGFNECQFLGFIEDLTGAMSRMHERKETLIEHRNRVTGDELNKMNEVFKELQSVTLNILSNMDLLDESELD
jgi:cellulose biosynthesis protein BcsQ